MTFFQSFIHACMHSFLHTSMLSFKRTCVGIDKNVAEMSVADAEQISGDGERSQRFRPQHLQEDEGFRRTRHRLHATTHQVPAQHPFALTLHCEGLCEDDMAKILKRKKHKTKGARRQTKKKTKTKGKKKLIM